MRIRISAPNRFEWDESEDSMNLMAPLKRSMLKLDFYYEHGDMSDFMYEVDLLRQRLDVAVESWTRSRGMGGQDDG